MTSLSLIIPVFNRPQELSELLESIAKQTILPSEVIIVEDGSTDKSDQIVHQYQSSLTLHYLYQSNTGPGPARNNGATVATGNYLIFLDSDVILPSNYIESVLLSLSNNPTDCFGGPDMAHPSFSPIQKAISYAMTSPLTTGGIRGGKIKMDKFYPRSFNMGVKQSVFKELNGFSPMRFGEDLDLSMRIIEKEFKTSLYPLTEVFHKRRNTFKSFFKQVYNSGIARINLYKKHPRSLKMVHALPSLYTIGMLTLIIAAPLIPQAIIIAIIPSVLIFSHALLQSGNVITSLLASLASNIQLIGYGSGFIKAFILRIILKRDEFHEFKTTFYK